MRLRINENPLHEKLERISENCMCTDYVGDVVKLLINKPKPYRIFYDMEHDVYGISDAWKNIHFTIAADMWNTGWVQQFMDQNEIDDISRNKSFGYYYNHIFDKGMNVNLIFVPNDNINGNAGYKDIRYEQFVELETGRLYMEDIYDFSSDGDLSDMYDYCQKFGYIVDSRYKVGISESVEKIDDVLVFDYAGDVVNTLINKPRVYRICYDPKNDVYGLGDAYKYIHGGIEKLMRELGYEPEPSKEGTHNYKEITFVPYDVKDDKWQVGGFVGERDKAVYVPSGFLLYNRVSSPEDYIPDLYDVLKRRGLISKHLDESQIESIKKTARKRLNDCYRRFDEITDIYEDNGFRLTDPDFHGYEDFKSYSDYFIKNPESWGFRPDFDGLFVDTITGRNMKAFDLYIGEGDDQMGVYWLWSDAMSSQSAIYKELMNLCKDYNIPYSTFYDL